MQACADTWNIQMLTQSGTAVVGCFLSIRWHGLCSLSNWPVSHREQWAAAETEHSGVALLGRKGGL